LRPSRLLNLGIYDSGGSAFGQELLQPDLLVAVASLDLSDSACFKRNLDTRGLNGRVLTFWQTNQADIYR